MSNGNHCGIAAPLVVIPLRATLAQSVDVPATTLAIRAASASLATEGYITVSYQADIVTSRPIVWLQDCPKLRHLAHVGVAVYDHTGVDGFGPYRIGRFMRNEVVVQWFERVPS